MNIKSALRLCAIIVSNPAISETAAESPSLNIYLNKFG